MSLIVDLWKARRRQPTEAAAFKEILTGVVLLPGMMLGVAAGVWLLPERAGEGALGIYCLAGAVVGSTVAGLTLTGAYRRFGFPSVIWIADAIIGANVALIAVPYLMFFSWGTAVAILLIPLGALVGVTVGAALGGGQKTHEKADEIASLRRIIDSRSQGVGASTADSEPQTGSVQQDDQRIA